MRPVATLLPILLLAGCHGSGVTIGEGAGSSRTYTVGGTAQAVDARGPDDVQIKHGAALAISATGPTSVLDALSFRIDSGTLIIERSTRVSAQHSAKITVTLPSVAGVAIDGSGDVMLDHADGARFAAAQSGTGDLRIDRLDVPTASLTMTGTGDLHAVGHVDTLSVSVSGTGSAEIDKLSADRATLTSSGTGDIDLGEAKTVTGSLSGTGSIKVAGHPSCSISTNGTGDVTCG